MSNRIKLILLVIVLTLSIVGITLGGPSFIHRVQMHFGIKGKVELIERCIAMPGCAISTQELELLERYETLQASDAMEEFKETELGRGIDAVDREIQQQEQPPARP